MNDTPIFGEPSATFMTVLTNALKPPQSCTPWFVGAMIPLWENGLALHMDPVVLIAQCALETGWGKFGGAMTPEHGNTCGLKNVDAKGDTPADLAHFPIDPASGVPMIGATAHVQHLSLYCGIAPPDHTRTVYDPRAKYVWPGTELFGSVRYVEDLGAGKWAPGADYGKNIVDIMTKLKKAV